MGGTCGRRAAELEEGATEAAAEVVAASEEYAGLKRRLLTSTAGVGSALTLYCALTLPDTGAPLGALVGAAGALYYLTELAADIDALKAGPPESIPVVAARAIEEPVPRLLKLVPALYAQALGSRRVWTPLAIAVAVTGWNAAASSVGLPRAGLAPALIGFALSYKVAALLVGWDDLKESMMDEERAKILTNRQRPTLVEPEDSDLDLYGRKLR